MKTIQVELAIEILLTYRKLGGLVHALELTGHDGESKHHVEAFYAAFDRFAPYSGDALLAAIVRRQG